MKRIAADTRVAVIIPAYGQPWLTCETLHTALNQIADFNYSIVIVNDGCPTTETHDVCQTFASGFPEQVFYLSRSNGGLSSARNCGIEFALAAFSQLEAVYFLDCDNRIGPHLLQRLVDALRTSGPEIGWAYPDVTKFGFAEAADTSGPYSPLEHLFRNFCEAGSMASRRMLDAGIRFDTEMRQGVEDWEFWLQGMEKGFRGVHVADTGFSYRRRGESMLVAAERDFASIKRYIRHRHPQLYNPRNVLRLEADARSRYAVYHPDTDCVSCFTVANDIEELTLQEFIMRLLQAGQRPAYGSCPGQLIAMSRSLFNAFQANGQLQGVLWTLECALSRSTFVECSVRHRVATRPSIFWTKGIDAQKDGSPDETILAIECTELVRHALSGATDIRGGVTQGGKQHQYLRFHIECSGAAPDQVDQSRDSLQILCHGISEVAGSARRELWDGVALDRYRAQTALPRHVYPELFNLPSVLPSGAEPGRRYAALILNSTETGKLNAAEDLAKALDFEGHIVHLFLFAPACPEIAARSSFSQIITMPLPHLLSGVRSDTYQAGLISRLEPGHMNEAIGALATYDRVVSVDGGLSHSLMGSLRRLKVETWALLGCDTGKVTSAEINACSAFEQAYSAIILPDIETAHLCRAFGIPDARLRIWSNVINSAEEFITADIS
ncbi:glycosyltransferase family 2 protein [Phyllobacterium lublinensis]|uniref:glycosyltransferase family 2 protein n=1 Tax=Phyllobacterium lublinensis TaxID=2875708 RepID=UPI001CCC7F10|nr:glycosyltransferase family A protein [Phyllobacterium sp. 2063]MBZ9655784.1 glycosyltransferase family 2 protein [Phyllobacterium sp. 2063]